MRSRKMQVIPARLKAGRLRFEQWRMARKGRSRIPERLWTSAVRLAKAYGLCRTAWTLGLDYNALVETHPCLGYPLVRDFRERLCPIERSRHRSSRSR